MADVNVNECDSFMVTPTLKSNAGDWKVCKRKNLMVVRCVRKIRPSGSLFGITWQSLVMPNRFFIRTSHSWKVLIIFSDNFSSVICFQVLDHTQVYPSQDVDNELCKLSIQLFRQAKSCTEKQTNNTDTTVVSKEVTCAWYLCTAGWQNKEKAAVAVAPVEQMRRVFDDNWR